MICIYSIVNRFKEIVPLKTWSRTIKIDWKRLYILLRTSQMLAHGIRHYINYYHDNSHSCNFEKPHRLDKTDQQKYFVHRAVWYMQWVVNEAEWCLWIIDLGIVFLTYPIHSSSPSEIYHRYNLSRPVELTLRAPFSPIIMVSRGQ